jgi:hypothetical protein
VEAFVAVERVLALDEASAALRAVACAAEAARLAEEFAV